MSVHNLSVVLTGNNSSLKSTLLASGRDVNTFSKQVEQAGRSGETSGKLLKAGLAIAAFAVAAALAYGVVQAAAFDREMRNVQSITKESDAQLARTSKTLVNMSTRLPQSAKTLAEGLYNIASSGFQGAAGLQVLEVSAEAASAGLTTTEVSARAITAVLNAYGLEAKDAADVSDVLFQTVNVGVITFEELASELGDVVGLAGVLTVGIDEVGSAIAAMTLSGISGAESATALNRTMQALADPSEELAAALKAVGYESGVQALEVDSLSTVMEKLRVQSGGNIEVLQKWFPEIRAMKGALALMANEGRNYAKVVAEIEDEERRAGATRAALKEQMKAATAQWQLFINKVNAGAITLGSKLLPAVVLVLDALTRLTDGGLNTVQDALSHLQPFVEALAGVWADVVDIVGMLGEELGPIAGLLAGMVGFGVIQTLNLLAVSLAAVTGFLADHPGLMKAVAMVAGGIYLTSILTAAVATGRLAAETAILKAMYAGEAIASGMKMIAFRAQMMGAGLYEIWRVGGSASGGIGMVKSSLGGLGAALSSPTVAMGLLVIGLASIAMGHQEAVNKAKKLRAELEDDIDYKSPASIIEGVRNIGRELDNLEKRDVSSTGVSGLFNNLIGGAQLAISILPGVDAKMHEVNVSIKELTDAERENLGIALQLQEKYAVVATRLGSTAAAVEAYIKANDLDPVTSSYDELEIAIGDVQKITENATPKQVAMADSMTKVADETSNAKDEVSAFKDMLDGLLGTELSWFDSQTKSRAAMDEFKHSMMETIGAGQPIGQLFDTLTEKGRANRDAISGVVDSWMGMANSLAAKGDMDGAVQTLKNMEYELRGVLHQAGIAPAEIEGLIASLGLVPGNYEALLTLTGEEAASAGLQELIDGLDGVDGTTATATVKIIDATGYNRVDIDSWILSYANSDPTARVYVDGETAKPSQEALELWAERYEDSDPTALALMSIFDPQGKYKNLRALANDYRGWNPTTMAKVDIVSAQQRIADLKANLATIPRSLSVRVDVSAVSGEGFLGGKNLVSERWGGTVYAYQSGGITPAHIQRGEQIKYAEPETGGEAFVPRLGDVRRSTEVLTEAASWYGYGLVKMEKGGWYMGNGAGAGGDQGRNDYGQYASMGQAPPVEVRLILDPSGADRQLVEMLRRMIRVEGAGNVQVALGQGGRG